MKQVSAYKGEMRMASKRKIILEDGQQYSGLAFGDETDKVCELVFNTSMVGYQEILSDPSYTDQAVVMTYPLIGNYGLAEEDYETKFPTIGALIVREYNDEPSNFRCTETLNSALKRFGVVGISQIDTRKLTRSIREHGSRKALLTDSAASLQDGLYILQNTSLPRNAVSRVSCQATWVSPAEQERYHVVAVDCGMKQNIVRSLNHRGCRVTVVPWNTCADEIIEYNPDGIIVSNGPGDPTDVPCVVQTLKSIIGHYPIFGICLGHQLISLAYGATTYKLKYGHRGGNHPVRNLETGIIEITSQNHSYAVDSDSLAKTRLKATHINLLDGTIEGVRCDDDRVFSVQYHPESAPGPQDSAYLFDDFIRIMEEAKIHA